MCIYCSTFESLIQDLWENLRLHVYHGGGTCEHFLRANHTCKGSPNLRCDTIDKIGEIMWFHGYGHPRLILVFLESFIPTFS
jgi:hypothetical protein